VQTNYKCIVGLILIIIILTRHQLAPTGLFRPRLIFPSQFFPVVLVHSVYNAALILPSCCSPFLLLVAATLVCMFLDSGQLVLISTLQQFLNYCSGHKGCNRPFFSPVHTFYIGNSIQFNIILSCHLHPTSIQFIATIIKKGKKVN